MKRKNHRRWGYLTALLSLSIKLVIVALHVPPAMAGGLPGDGLFSQIVLCTAAGYRVIQLDENGQPVETDQNPGSNAQSCPICTSLSGAPFAPVPDSVALPLPSAAVAAFNERADSLVMGDKPLVVRGRGPPAQV